MSYSFALRGRIRTHADTDATTKLYYKLPVKINNYKINLNNCIDSDCWSPRAAYFWTFRFIVHNFIRRILKLFISS